MKTKIFTILLALIVSAGTLFASNTQVDGIWYDFDSSNKTAKVTFQGPYSDSYTNEYIGTIIIPSSVIYTNVEYCVTSIGNYAFSDCSSLTSVTIPNSVTSIGNCAFISCKSLTSVIIGSSVDNIGKDAFYGCSGLTSVTIPSSVTSIEKYAFYDCNALTSVTINSNKIVNNAYDFNSSIVDIFGSQVQQYIIGGEVTSIGEWTFYKCTRMKSVTIPNSVTSIKGDAFRSCSGLKTLNIPNTVTSIGSYAFGESGLTSIEIPNSVTSMGSYVFKGCSTLKSVSIPNSVTAIGNQTFYGCHGLTSVTIPNSVTSIGDQAFSNCTGLTSIVMQAETPPSLGVNSLEQRIMVFDGDDQLKSIYVPCGTKDTYKSNWLTYSAKIKYQPYSITTNSQNGSITLNPSQYASCSDVSLTAIPNEGYHFTQWSDGNTQNPRTIYLEQDTVITAEFSNLYSINVSCNELYGTVDGGKGMFEYLSEHTFEAIPNNGFHFTQWSDGVTNNPRTIIITRDTAIIAEFAINHYTITDNSDNTKGTIKGIGTFEHLKEVTLTATPNYGYHFTQWSDGNTDNPRILVLTQDTALTAEFAKNPVITYICSPVEGRINGDTIIVLEAFGQIACEAIPSYGYHFAQWADGNTDNPRTIELTQDTTMEAVFAINKYSISVTCDNTQGSIDGESGEFEYLTELTYEAVPKYGYHFDHWSYLGNPIENNYELLWDYSKNAPYYNSDNGLYYESKVNDTYLKGIKLNASGYCYFTKDALRGTLELSYAPRTSGKASLMIETWEGGQASWNKPANLSLIATTPEVATLTTVSIELTENQNNIFIERLAEKETVLQKIQFSPSYYINGDTIDFIAKNEYAIEAVFAPNTYTLSAIDNPNGEIIGMGEFAYLTKCSVSATPNYGYHFVQWSDGNIDNPRTIELTQDTTMEAVFAINKYPISVTCDESQGSIEGESGEFDYLTKLTYTAVPKYGYHFTGWSDDITTNPRTIELTQDTTFEAMFAPNSYIISDNSINGHIDGIGTFDYLSACTLTAVPDNGYHFVQWSDGVTDNPREFVLTQDTAFTAEMTADTNGQCGDNLYWSLNDDILTITGSGDMWQGQPWVASNAAIKQVNLPQGLTSIGNRAFYYCSSLTSIEIPNSVKRIDDQAFRGCTGLTSIEIPTSIESIGAKTFYYCTSLTSIIIPNNVTRIEEGTFYGCSSLSSVVIGNSVSYIGYEAFRNCSKLSSLDIPNSVETIDSKAFRECGSLTSVTIGNGVTSIGEYAFRDCGKITSVVWNAKNSNAWNFGSQVTSFTFGNEVEVIPASICSGMNQLTIMTIPNSVTKIETKAFYNCSGLTKLTLGSGLQSIDEYAFAECKNFDDITCYATTVPTIYATTFDNIGNKQYIYLFVPEGCQRAYKRDTYWGEFDVQIKNAESVTIPDENVIITPTDNSVEIIWPAVANTKTYEIVITKGDEKICTLVFNEQGQLNEISFAPARYERQAQTSGFQFTVTSLASGTTYGYSVIAKDDIGNPIDSKSGSFTTTGVATAHDQITNDQSPITNKIIKDNQILILRGDKTYTLQGQEVK